VKFQTKWQLALELIDEAQKWGLRCGVVLADAGYGEVTEFRQGLETRQLPYAVGIPSTLGVWTKPPRIHKLKARGQGRPPSAYHYGPQRPGTVREVAQKARGWKQVRWREGTKAGSSPASMLAACNPRMDSTKADPRTRRSGCWWNGRAARKNPPNTFSATCRSTTPLRRLVRIVKARWKIEQDYQQLKEELGLDHYEGRSWAGWHHHVTLVMLAHAFLTLEMLRSKKNFWVDPATDAP
jgi:SRSO17 transposase